MEPTPDGDPVEPAKGPFRPGDHVWMWCQTIGGFRYQHHGIVMKVVQNDEGAKNLLKIADFTAPENETFALPTSSASNISNHDDSSQWRSQRLPQWHGIRINTCDGAEWHREEYYPEQEEEPGQSDDSELVVHRVHFLLQRPDLIPEYELLESNCETVAVWCKTGQFRTHQVAGLMGGGKRNSAVATGTAAFAASVLGAPVLPVVAVGAGIWAGISHKHNNNEDKWRERTRILNEEFDKWLEHKQSGHCIVL